MPSDVERALAALLASRKEFASRDLVERTGLSRQALHRHLVRAVREGRLERVGAGRSTRYRAARGPAFDLTYVTDGLREDEVSRELDAWLDERGVHRSDAAQAAIAHVATQLVDNAIDHSGGERALLRIAVTATTVQIRIEDDGVGIFRKIARELDLPDEREAILELSKGKLTTDRAHHSGEGIFFTSRMFDSFTIDSMGLNFDHTPKDDWLLEVDSREGSDSERSGTTVTMTLFRDSGRTSQEVFDRYAGEESDYAFTRTHVPLSLAQYGRDLLVSRSQARRVLARFDRFEEAILDFKNVPRIGQAFADEIFRVHMLANPDAKILIIHANQQVRRMIRRARTALKEDRMGPQQRLPFD